jgi:hypothetical protein
MHGLIDAIDLAPQIGERWSVGGFYLSHGHKPLHLITGPSSAVPFNLDDDSQEAR